MITLSSSPDLVVSNLSVGKPAYKSFVLPVGVDDYTSYVLPLVKLTDADEAANYVCGTLFIKRWNGAAGNFTAVDITASKTYATEHCYNHTIIRGGSYEYARPCMFRYNGIKYFGIQGEVPSACPTFSEFFGLISDDSFVKYIPYKNNQTDEIIDTEINDSLSVQEYDSTVYRVGAIYVNTVDISPASIYGGTWERLTQDAYFKIVTSNAGQTGGTSIDHRIPLESSPQHNHTVLAGTYGVMSDGYTLQRGYNEGTASTAVSQSISMVGGGNPYYPYYFGVFAWKRTA